MCKWKTCLRRQETGRYAQLVGYDPTCTMSYSIPVVTVYLKVKANNDTPVLLKINEAVHNASSPFTLLSEYQIREFGYIDDSATRNHQSSADTYDTQQLLLKKRICVPFEDMGGIMGFEIPIEDDEIEELHSSYDTFF